MDEKELYSAALLIIAAVFMIVGCAVWKMQYHECRQLGGSVAICASKPWWITMPPERWVR